LRQRQVLTAWPLGDAADHSGAVLRHVEHLECRAIHGKGSTQPFQLRRCGQLVNLGARGGDVSQRREPRHIRGRELDQAAGGVLIGGCRYHVGRQGRLGRNGTGCRDEAALALRDGGNRGKQQSSRERGRRDEAGHGFS